MVTTALNGALEKASFKHHDIFNLEIPTSCPGVPSEILDPSNTWSDKEKYIVSAKRLATLFVKNFEKFRDVSKEIRNAGPNFDYRM
jgi:phosphoenolpyruvate carboxykinase (ATP)